MSTSFSGVVTFASVGFAACLAHGGDRSYTYYDMGFFGCPSDAGTQATDVNDVGVVAGYSVIQDCTATHAFT